MNFTLFSHQPTDVFIAAIGRCWDHGARLAVTTPLLQRAEDQSQPAQTEHGWIDPRNVNSGYLRLATDGYARTEHRADAGEQHSIHVKIGGMMSEWVVETSGRK